MDEDIKKMAMKFSKLAPPSSDEETGLHTYTMGALYSYACLKEHNYDESEWGNRDWNVRYKEVYETTKDLCGGKSIKSGQWLAEYYYNNLIHRLDVTFERIANRVMHVKGVGIKDAIPVLKSINGYKDVWAKAWIDVREDEANPIKHRSPEKLQSTQRLSTMKLQNIIYNLIEAIDWAQSQP